MNKQHLTEQELELHRKEINRLDKEIVQLLNDRISHAVSIGEIKLRDGQEIYAPHREKEVFDRIKSMNQGPVKDESLCSIYREVMSAALALQKTLVVAYLGPEATFTHQAALRRFGSSLTYSPLKTVADVFAEVSKGRADYGVAPVENSTEGVVNNTLDMLVDTDLKIVAQIMMGIRQCLIGLGKKEDIRRIYSHPQAIAQCRFWIQRSLPHAEIVETSSTTRAAELATSDPSSAALAGALAAETYDLDILEDNVQDSQANFTRFLVLGRQCPPRTGKDRSSLMISVPDRVGALFEALEPFTKAKVNMTRIESRPNKRKAWEYYFFLDVEGHTEDPQVAEAIAELEKRGAYVKILGSYPESEWV
ncbi:MAG TPA: prephenate dehydratase [Verrucomicrobiota bacterium]|nr:prephenate dehydratase [Verrucomicrobiota bacterium]